MGEFHSFNRIGNVGVVEDTGLKDSAGNKKGTMHVTMDAETSRAGAAGDVHAPAANAAAVVTYAAVASKSHVIGGLAWSYTDDPTGGNIKIEDGAGNVVFSLDIPAKGIGSINFPQPKKGAVNTAMIVTLAAGGASVTGKISVLSHWTE